MNVLKKNKGFTLVELIVVIAIIGILSAVLIPSFTGYIKDAKVSVDEQEAKAIYDIYNLYKTEVEQELTSMNFPDYYKDITGKELQNFSFCYGNKGNLVIVWPGDGLTFPANNSQVISETTHFIFDGNYALLIDAQTGAILEAGADSAARAAWLN